MTEHHGCQSKSDDYSTDIISSTTLLNDLFEEKIGFDEFLLKYDNFYYRLGIDELPALQKDCIFKYSDIVDMHKKIQESVINLIYPDSGYDIEYLHSIGRISKAEGLCKLKEILNENRGIFCKYVINN